MRKLAYIAVAGLALGLAAPGANAQEVATMAVINDRAQCISNFDAVDLNGDGTISYDERLEFKGAVPTILLNEAFIDRQSYLFACYAHVRAYDNAR